MSDVVSAPGEVIGLPQCNAAYPLLISISGETKIGKTYFGASFPNAFIIDFPPVKFGFRSITFDPVALNRSVGEGWRSIARPERRAGGVQWVSKVPGFDLNKQYCFAKTYADFMSAIARAKEFKSTIPQGEGNVWIILDDTYRWRGLEIQRWVEDTKLNSKRAPFPAKEQFGHVTQNMQSVLTEIQQDFNVAMIHRIVPDYETGEPKAQIYPSGADYISDASLRLTRRKKGDDTIQVAEVLSNAYMFEFSPEFCREIESPSPIEVLIALMIPRELW